jgi:hypothetical protein
VAAYFFDSSALVKRYVNETGSTWVEAATDPDSGAHVYVAAITGVEVIAALSRKRKGNLVARKTLQRPLGAFSKTSRTSTGSSALAMLLLLGLWQLPKRMACGVTTLCS